MATDDDQPDELISFTLTRHEMLVIIGALFTTHDEESEKIAKRLMQVRREKRETTD